MNLLQDMSLREMQQTNGGIDPLAVITILSFCIYIYNEGGDFVEGFKEGYNGK